jgi:WXXGXW repeat (2 copies)
MIQFKKYTLLGSLTAITLGGGLLTMDRAIAQPNTDNASAEVLTRGPVHEAFAGTISYDPTPGVIVDQAPPTLIEEVPPEQRLEGENVTWIPGYWAWDEDQNDFLWVSGIWRNLPPGREWVPGYWSDADGRHQWTSGYWEDAENTEVSYLPQPPRSVESGPSVEATSNDQTWIPGNWSWRENRYAWRAGYWVGARENWSWTPAYYRWTHRGYVYVDGYWDYPVARRGVVFAPIHFQREYISRPDFYYSPVTVISLSVFTNHLFLRPNYGHYYFGDYYEPRYRDRGYFASYSYNSGRRGYDPIYAYDRWENRNDRNWGRQRQEYFEYRRDNRDSRPPSTWVALSARSQADRERGDFGVADRFDRVVESRAGGRQRFQALNKQERDGFVSQRQEIRKFGKEREQLETRGQLPAADRAKNNAESNRVKVGRSPVISKKSDRSDQNGGPPARLQSRDSDPTAGRQKQDRQDLSKPQQKKDGAATRDGELRKNGKPETAVETRTKPGQKRDADRVPGKAKPQEKRQPELIPERQANPNSNPKRQPAPNPERKIKSEEKRQTKPNPERQANPAPQRLAEPIPKRQTNPQPNRQANPAPRRQAEPAPQRKQKVDDNRDSASAQFPKTVPQPQPIAAKRQEPKRVAKAEPQLKLRQPPSAPAQQPRHAYRPQSQETKPQAPSRPDQAKTNDGTGRKKKPEKE